MEYHDDAGHIRGPIPTFNKLVEVDPNDIRAPFPVLRVYSLVDCNGVRGKHAHRRLKQLVVCPKGSVTIDLEGPEGKQSFTLDTPAKGLLIGPDTWRELRDFAPGTVVTVLASERYDESDYIRDYGEFLASCPHPNPHTSRTRQDPVTSHPLP